MKSVLGDDTGKMVEMMTEDLEYDINLVDKAAAGFESIDYNLKKNFYCGSNSIICIACYREILYEGKSQSI